VIPEKGRYFKLFRSPFNLILKAIIQGTVTQLATRIFSRHQLVFHFVFDQGLKIMKEVLSSCQRAQAPLFGIGEMTIVARIKTVDSNPILHRLFMVRKPWSKKYIALPRPVSTISSLWIVSDNFQGYFCNRQASNVSAPDKFYFGSRGPSWTLPKSELCASWSLTVKPNFPSNPKTCVFLILPIHNWFRISVAMIRLYTNGDLPLKGVFRFPGPKFLHCEGSVRWFFCRLALKQESRKGEK